MNNRYQKMVCALSGGLLSAILLVGCGKAVDKNITAEVAAPVVVAPAKVAEAVHAELLGTYVGRFEPTPAFAKVIKDYDVWLEKYGDFGGSRNLNETPAPFRKYMYRNALDGTFELISPNRLALVLDEMREDNTFTAHSVAAGNERLVTGTWSAVGKGFHLMGKEPGDKPIDGVFDMTLNTADASVMGTWQSNAAHSEAKKLVLKKIEFKYDAKRAQNPDRDDEYVNLGRSEFDKNPSVDVLKSSDVENLTQKQIRVIRNLIFARHGYSFGAEDLRRMFEAYDWYQPLTTDVKDVLTEVEKNNLAILKRYEKYADTHYDEFGR